MSVLLWSLAAPTLSTQVGIQSTHDPIANFEVLDFRPSRNDCSGALVGCCLWKLRAKDAFDDHAIGVAQGGYGYFDEDVAWCEGRGRRKRDSMDLVRFVDCGGLCQSSLRGMDWILYIR